MEASRTFAGRMGAVARSAGAAATVGLILGLAGGALLVVAELSTLFTVDVARGTCEELAGAGARDSCETTGLEQHGGALIVLGVAAVVMALAAGRGKSRPAAIALLVIGGLTLALALFGDVPELGEKGVIGLQYERGETVAAGGLYLEIIGAALCVLAGGLTLPRPEP
jgi:hypothetical protein